MADGGRGAVVFQIDVHWTAISRLDDERWWWNEVLYAYVAPRTRQLLYIGKAVRATVYDRWRADDKLRRCWAKIDAHGIHAHEVLVGQLVLGDRERFSTRKLSDAETLLIFYHQPLGNTHARRTCTLPDGIRVRCSGAAWPRRAPRTASIGVLKR